MRFAGLTGILQNYKLRENMDIKRVAVVFEALNEALQNGDDFDEFRRKLSERLAAMGEDRQEPSTFCLRKDRAA